jgi:hypothetical protein
LPDEKAYDFIPEAVAGSLEPGDMGKDGFLGRVIAEVWEEAGFRIAAPQIESLGGGFFPSHGQSSEKIHLCAVRVDPGTACPATGDGSVNEEDAPPIRFRPLREILMDCAGGSIEDPKVEILAWRLSLKLGYMAVEGRYAKIEEVGSMDEFRRSFGPAPWEAEVRSGQAGEPGQ